MTSSRLKLYVSLFVVFSHILIYFGVLGLKAFVVPNADIFEIMGAMIPLFGVFLIVIIKDTVRGREDLRVGNVQTQQMVMLTFSMLGAYILAAFSALGMVAKQTITVADLSRWLTTVEAAFGMGLGLIIDDLFGGKSTEGGDGQAG